MYIYDFRRHCTLYKLFIIVFLLLNIYLLKYKFDFIFSIGMVCMFLDKAYPPPASTLLYRALRQQSTLNLNNQLNTRLRLDNIFRASSAPPCIHAFISLLSVVSWGMDPSYSPKSSLMFLT